MQPPYFFTNALLLLRLPRRIFYVSFFRMSQLRLAISHFQFHSTVGSSKPRQDISASVSKVGKRSLQLTKVSTVLQTCQIYTPFSHHFRARHSSSHRSMATSITPSSPCLSVDAERGDMTASPSKPPSPRPPAHGERHTPLAGVCRHQLCCYRCDGEWVAVTHQLFAPNSIW
jgi:hypothetical protein